MDLGGLQCNGSRDSSQMSGATGAGVASRDSGDTSGLLPQSAKHLPSSGTLHPPVGARNGRVGGKNQGDLGGLFESSQYQDLFGGEEVKPGKVGRIQKAMGVFNMDDNLALLNENISNLDQTAKSVISISDTLDLFPQSMKQEQLSLDKDLGHCGHSGAGLYDGSSSCIEESEILRNLDLLVSLPEMSDADFGSEVALFDTLHVNSGGGAAIGDLLKEPRPLVGDGDNCTNANGKDQQHHPVHHHHHHHHQQQQPQQSLLQHQQRQLQHHTPSLLSSIKIENDADDSFSHIRTTRVVKQEEAGPASFCQSQCLQSSRSSMPSSMGIDTGPVFHYRSNPSSSVAQHDQKPFGMFSNLPPEEGTWIRGSRYGESSVIPGRDDGLPSAAALAGFPNNFSK